jgi:uncharacterized protein (DUF58 family)
MGPRLAWAEARAALAARLDRWLLRLRPDEAAPVVLVQRRIFVLPTPAGLAFAATLLTLLIASINYSLNLGYAFTFLLAGAAVASIVHAFRNLLNLSIRPGGATPAFAGGEARFSLAVHNPADRPRPALAARAAGGPTTDFAIAAGDSAYVELRRPAPRRGRLPLGRLTLETRYPLGLIRAWSVLAPRLETLVYPAPEAHPPPLPAAPALTPGELRGQFGRDDFHGMRPHTASDSPRHIAWKVYAREGPLVVKEFAGGDDAEIILDWATLPPELEPEARLSRLTAWVCDAERLGRRYRLRLPGRAFAGSTGPAHARQCLEALALFDAPPAWPHLARR